MPTSLPAGAIDAAVRAALVEDVGHGDLTTQGVIPSALRASATIVARESCIIAGLPVAVRVFKHLDSSATFQKARADGDRAKRGDVIFRVRGRARALLTGERVALNFVQRLCGIATLTRSLVDAAGRGVSLLHTRKTTPGLRALELYAVEVGGGRLHRKGLFDEVLIKENHFALSGKGVAETVKKARESAGPGTVVGAEARNFAEASAAIDGGADYVLLDNYSPADLAIEVKRLRPTLQKTLRESGRRVLLEASGGIGKDNIAAYAKSGVDRISVGALTHSARAVDLALDVEVLA